MKKSRAHFRWLLNTLRVHCNDNEAAELSFSLIERDFGKSVLFFTSSATYTKLFEYIFNEKTKDPIDSLQKKGYYLRGDKKILNSHVFNEREIGHLIECFMWAFLDNKIPRNLIQKKIGRVKVVTCSDPEQILCCWINSCNSPLSKKVQQITAISQHFIGSRNFRGLLYSYMRDESLLEFKDPATNAQEALKACVKIGLTPPFDQFNYKQSPLVIMCFLIEAVSVLDKVKPLPGPRPVSKLDIQRVNYNIIIARRDVDTLKARVGALSNDVQFYTSRLSKMRRPASAFAVGNKGDVPHVEIKGEEENADVLPPLVNVSGSSSGRPKSAMRVRWDIPPDHLPENQVHSTRSEGQATTGAEPEQAEQSQNQEQEQ